MGKPITKANHKYNAKVYDRIGLYIPTGTKPIWQDMAQKNNKSLTEFIVEAVEKY